MPMPDKVKSRSGSVGDGLNLPVTITVTGEPGMPPLGDSIVKVSPSFFTVAVVFKVKVGPFSSLSWETILTESLSEVILPS